MPPAGRSDVSAPSAPREAGSDFGVFGQPLTEPCPCDLEYRP